MKKQHLLPFPWQKAGYALLLAGIVLSAIFYIPEVLRGEYGTADNPVGTLSFFVLLPLSAIILCFSRERVEDERIEELRMRSVSITAVVFVILLFVRPIVSFFLARLFPAGVLGKWHLIFSSAWWMLFVYLLIFKITYWIQDKRYSNEK